MKRKTAGIAGCILIVLVILAIAIPGIIQSRRATGERNAPASLKSIATAQADFRANDRDGNGKPEFWRADIAGLYAGKDKEGRPVKLIDLSVAAADDRAVVDMAPHAPLAPKAGVWYRALRHEGEMALDPDRFAACAFPADYPSTGRWTYIIDENNVIYLKDLGHGRAVKAFPSDPGKDGWKKLD